MLRRDEPQQAPAQQAQPAAQQGAQPARQQQQQQQASSSLSGDVGVQKGRVPAGGGGGRANGVQPGGRKRQIVDVSETSDDDKSGLQSLMKGVEMMAAQGGRGMAPRGSSLQLSGAPDSGTGGSTAGGSAASGRTARAAKQPRRASASPAAQHVPGERPWQEEDVLAFTYANHPFHGISREAAVSLACTWVVDWLACRGLHFTSRTTLCTACTWASWSVAACWVGLRVGAYQVPLAA